jgi:hypothetical protein
VVIEDDAYFDTAEELQRLCTVIEKDCGLKSICIFRPPDSGDVVLNNLIEFSIRFHPLVETSPNIIDAMLLVTGELPLEAVRAAGTTTNAKRVRQAPAVPTLLNECIRYTLGAVNAVERDNLWLAVELLTRIRDLLMQVFSLSRGGSRPLHDFQQQADTELQARFAKLLPQLDKPSLKASLFAALNLLENDLPRFTSIDILNDTQRDILLKIRRLVEE